MKMGWRMMTIGVVATVASFAYAQDASQSGSTTQIQLVAAKTELSKALDAKKLKQGDPVTAKTTDDVKFSTGTTLPKGSLILGHVDKVQASENKGDSTVVLIFDKAQPKNGQPITVKAVVMAIYPPVSAMSNAATVGVQPSKPTQPSQGVTEQKDAMPGVDLHSDLSESTSATLSSKGKNVKLADGTQWEFAIAAMPEGTAPGDSK
jgi:hypothetical protein